MNKHIKTGFIGINKPRGISSAFVVNKIKYLLRSNGVKLKLGHMGTLDVDANGVLVVAIGGATKLFDLFLQKQKTYQTVFKFGYSTTTDDNTGEIVNTGGFVPSEKQILDAIKILERKTEQVPPQYSANKVGGVKAYARARRGEKIEPKSKSIQIYSFKLLEKTDDLSYKFEIECSSGTYIRALCRDMASIIGTYGITSAITRTICSVFNINNCLNMDGLNFDNIAGNIKNPDESLPFIGKLTLEKEQITKLKNGLLLDFDGKDGLYFIENIMVARVNNHKIRQDIYLGEV